MKWIREDHTRGLFEIEGADIWIEGSIEKENNTPQYFFSVCAQAFYLDQFERMKDAEQLAIGVYKELSQPCPNCGGARRLKDKPENLGFHQACNNVTCTWHEPFEVSYEGASFNEYENQPYRISP